MNDSLFRLLIDSGTLQWVPGRGFPFQVDASCIKAARHLERLAHYYAKRITQILKKAGEEGKGVALSAWQPRDERLATAVALQLWGEFHLDTSLFAKGQPPMTLDASLFILTDLYPRAETDAPPPIEGPALRIVSALSWDNSQTTENQISLATIAEALERGISTGVWPEEARSQWNRFLFHQALST